MLAQRVEKQFLKPDRKEALLTILGQDFTDKYLPTARRNPWVLVSVLVLYTNELMIYVFTTVTMTYYIVLVINYFRSLPV